MSDPLRARLLAIYADEHRDHLSALRTALTQGAAADFEEAYRHAHSLKGAARAVELPPVVDLAHGLESLLEAWWVGGAVPDADLTRRAVDAVDAIEDLSAAALAGGAVPRSHPALNRLTQGLRALGLSLPAPPAAAEVFPVCTPMAVTATLRVEAEAADRLALGITTLLSELERQRNGESLLRRLSSTIDRLVEQAAGRDGASSATGLRDRFAEMLRVLDERDWAVSRVAEALAEDVARLRLVAAEGMLGSFGPMLRTLAAELGKDIRYQAHGLATLADREVLVVVAEAVLHLLRNAVAHGIETPDERRAAGKESAGRLSLGVEVSGARLEISVSDDGGGIPTARLAAQAVARGVLTPAQAERADPDRLHQLVFHPGLSTAGSLSTTAGRGMGMSIVRRLVDRLQGNVVMRSAPGQGTRVVLSVPISIMAQRVVLVRVRGSVFGLPAPAVTRLLHLSADGLLRLDGGAVAMIDGAEVAVADLGVLLGLPGEMETRQTLCVVLVHVATETVALVVDEVIDVRDLPVSPLDIPVAEDDRLVGTVMLEQGELALVLSPAGLRTHGGPDTEALPPHPEPKPSPLVLVADDSATIRTLERGLLESHGYRVEVAVDGRDALERMATTRPDLVVSDIEMPRLDGFGLLAAMRGDARLAMVPVVLVSSRAGAEDRRRGTALGAKGYLAKNAFDQNEFLNTVARLTA